MDNRTVRVNQKGLIGGERLGGRKELEENGRDLSKEFHQEASGAKVGEGREGTRLFRKTTVRKGTDGCEKERGGRVQILMGEEGRIRELRHREGWGRGGGEGGLRGKRAQRGRRAR